MSHVRIELSETQMKMLQKINVRIFTIIGMGKDLKPHGTTVLSIGPWDIALEGMRQRTRALKIKRMN